MKQLRLKVGMLLYYVPYDVRRGVPFELRVESIGRKWVTLRHVGGVFNGPAGRCDFFGERDGGSYTSPGRCWQSKQHYEEHVASQHAWAALAGAVNNAHACPPNVSPETISYIRHLLGFDTHYERGGTP